MAGSHILTEAEGRSLLAESLVDGILFLDESILINEVEDGERKGDTFHTRESRLLDRPVTGCVGRNPTSLWSSFSEYTSAFSVSYFWQPWVRTLL